jgi:phage regulator Rha-like protein
MTKSKSLTVTELEQSIHEIRGHRVMLDEDLAAVYGVSVGRLNEQVKRNKDRFPPDFMFRLNAKEWERLRSQIAILKTGGRGAHRKYLPFVFTEHGAIMLANVLRSKTAVQASIQVVRAFVRLRELAATHKDLLLKINRMEKKYDQQFKAVFDAIRQLMLPPKKTKRSIGF